MPDKSYENTCYKIVELTPWYDIIVIFGVFLGIKILY